MTGIAHNSAGFMLATHGEWQSSNPVVPKRTFAVSSDTGEIRLGDGTAHWADLLVYATSSSDTSADSALYAAITGATFTGDIQVPDNAYNSSTWDGSTKVPTRNAVRDQMETRAADSAVVHVSGNETIAGTKTFSSAPAVPDNSFVTAKISGFDTQVRTSRLDQMTAPTADVPLNSHKITGLANPTAAQDAMTKGTADTSYASVSPRPSGDTTGATDTATIQALLNAAAATASSDNSSPASGVGTPSGSLPEVALQYGTYYINATLTVSNRVRLRGMGPGLTELKAVNGLNADVVQASGTNMWGSQVCDLMVNGNKANQSAGNGLVWKSHGNFAPYLSGTHVVGSPSGDLIENVFIINAYSIGLSVVSGSSELRVLNVSSFGAGLIGIQVASFDGFYSNCTAAGSYAQAWRITGAVNRFVGCKAYGANESGNYGACVQIEGADNYLTAFEVQETPKEGFLISSGATGTRMTGCTAYGVALNGLNIQEGSCDIELAVKDGYTYTATGGVGIGASGKTGNRIRLNHLAACAAVVNDPIGNTIEVNNQLGVQSLAYASSLTPNPYLGGQVVIGSLTGNITVNVPTSTNRHTGVRMALQFTQDGTGGRTVTFGTGFSVIKWAANMAASSVSRIEFVFDGTNWVQVSAPAASLYATPLAQLSYNPTPTGSATVVSTLNTVSAPLTADATNLALTVIVPASGRIKFVLNGLSDNDTFNQGTDWCLMNGGVFIPGTLSRAMNNSALSGSTFTQARATLILYVTTDGAGTALVPGASQTFAWGLCSTNSGAHARLIYGGTIGPATMEAWAA